MWLHRFGIISVKIICLGAIQCDMNNVSLYVALLARILHNHGDPQSTKLVMINKGLFLFGPNACNLELYRNYSLVSDHGSNVC